MRVLELFKGTGSIEKAFKSIDENIEVISLDIDKRFNPTHLCNILDFDYKQYPNNHFDIIWGSPPCDKFSILRNCWIGRTFKDGRLCTKELLEDEIKTIGLPPLYKTKEIIEYFKPKYYFIENPASSKMKDYIDNNFLYDINKYVVSYCKYGFDYQKNTNIWTNLSGFIPKKCKNDCDSIIKINDNQNLHYNNLGTIDYINLDNKIIPLNTKEKREKYKDYKKISKLDLINKKHKKNMNNIGSGTNKDERYRIPQPLLIELFNLCI